MESPSSPSLRATADQHLKAGELADAIRCYREHLLTTPGDVEARFALGNAHAAAQQWQRAAEAFAAVIEARPQAARAHASKALVERELGNLPAAADGFAQAISIEPSADLHNQLGTTYAQMGRRDLAIAAFQQAVECDPQAEAAHANLMQALILNRNPQAAIAMGHRALKIHQNSFRILKLLGDAWLNSKVLHNAVECYERALKLAPDAPEVHLTMGIACGGLCDLERAEKHYLRAQELGVPGDLIHANLGELYRKRRDLPTALQHQRKALALNPEQPEAHSNLLLTMLYDEQVRGEDLCREAKAWYAQHAAHVEPLPSAPPAGDNDRLKVAYLSGSFHQHPVGLFLHPVVQHHDRDHYEVHCYAHQEIRDEVTEDLQEAADHWTDVNALGDRELAEQIRADGIDILVDLCGHTWPNRLGALTYRAAPVQLTWMGFSCTTGIPTVDGVIGDRWVTPAEDAAHFTESIVHLPYHYLCFEAPKEEVSSDRADDQAPFTFGCLNNLAKIGPAVLDTWAEILRQAPGTRLYLKTPSLSDPVAQEQTREEFQRRGVEADRITMEGQGSRRDFLEGYRNVDLALDPFPFHGGMTTMETLWMGVPMVTLVGQRFVARVGDSFLRAIGYEDLITYTTDDYCARAVEASQSIWSSEQRAQLREEFLISPLCQVAEFTQGLEQAYRQLLSSASTTRD